MIARIPYEHMNWVWISSFWDVPLRGLCKYNGKLCRFQGFGWVYGKKMSRYHIIRLSTISKTIWIIRKFLFEFMVGKHWSSYPDGVKYKHKRFLTGAYYIPFSIKWRFRRLFTRG